MTARCASEHGGRFVRRDRKFCDHCFGLAMVEVEASCKRGAETLPHHADFVYPDAANDLARGKHRKPKTIRRTRWWRLMRSR